MLPGHAGQSSKVHLTRSNARSSRLQDPKTGRSNLGSMLCVRTKKPRRSPSNKEAFKPRLPPYVVSTRVRASLSRSSTSFSPVGRCSRASRSILIRKSFGKSHAWNQAEPKHSCSASSGRPGKPACRCDPVTVLRCTVLK